MRSAVLLRSMHDLFWACELAAGMTSQTRSSNRTGRSQGARRWVIFAWFAATLRQYPEIAIFLTLAIGYYFGKFTFKGIGLGSVTATLLAGVVIGQIGITISQPLKATVFLLFLFAVGYGVGPQFVRGVAKDGVPQALFAVVQCVFCLAVPVVIVKMAGYDLGYAAGFYSGSQTISAAMGLSTDAINRLGLAADEAKNLLDSMPVAYAVTYMFGTVGSAIVIALLGPAPTPLQYRRRLQGLRGEAGRYARSLAGRARPGTAGRCARSVCNRAPESSASGPSRPRRCSPNAAYLSSAYAVTGLLKRQLRTLYCEKATSWRLQVLARRS